jgi:hypothetical protein
MIRHLQTLYSAKPCPEVKVAAHESARTTKLYDRRSDKVTLDEVERIVL